jgi:hypothetical protein
MCKDSEQLSRSENVFAHGGFHLLPIETLWHIQFLIERVQAEEVSMATAWRLGPAIIGFAESIAAASIAPGRIAAGAL